MNLKIRKQYLLVLFMLIPGFVFSQALKIDGNGRVAINGAPVASYNLFVYGKLATSELFTPVIRSGSSLYIDVPHTGIGCSSANNSTLKISGEYNSYALYVDGRAYVTSGVWETSDGRMKKDIQAIDRDENFNKLLQLQSKTYMFKSRNELEEMCDHGILSFAKDTTKALQSRSMSKKTHYDLPLLPTGRQYGLLAEEVELVFPEFVMTDSITNTKSINYVGLVPVLVEAVKTQHQQLNALEERLKGLEGY